MRAAVVLMSLLLAAQAIAQQPSVDESLDAEGRALFAAGRAAFGAERFEDALGHFQAAYDRSRRPELLYNVALAADRLGRHAIALDAYEKYLHSLPDSPFAPQASERIAALRIVVQGERTNAVNPDGVPVFETQQQVQQQQVQAEQQVQQEQQVQAEQQAQAEQQVQAEQQEQQEQQEMTEPARSLRVPGLALLAGGGAVLVVGVVLIGTATSARSNVEETYSPIWTDGLQDDYDAARRRTISGIVLGGVGLATAAAGLLMLVLGPRDDESVAFDIGPGSVSLRGAF